MENRSLFALHGITGMLIATALLLTILVVFTIMGIGIQQDKATDHYVIENPKEIKMFSTENAKHKVDYK